MAMGMTVEEYWHGSADLPEFYRESYRLKQREQNNMLWLQGKYIYDALLCASPMFLSLVKKREPVPYVKEPYPLDAKEARERQERDELKKQKESMERMKAQFALWNKSYEAEEEGGEKDERDPDR